jgi:hypothetical protein
MRIGLKRARRKPEMFAPRSHQLIGSIRNVVAAHRIEENRDRRPANGLIGGNDDLIVIRGWTRRPIRIPAVDRRGHATIASNDGTATCRRPEVAADDRDLRTGCDHAKELALIWNISAGANDDTGNHRSKRGVRNAIAERTAHSFQQQAGVWSCGIDGHNHPGVRPSNYGWGSAITQGDTSTRLSKVCAGNGDRHAWCDAARMRADTDLVKATRIFDLMLVIAGAWANAWEASNTTTVASNASRRNDFIGFLLMAPEAFARERGGHAFKTCSRTSLVACLLRAKNARFTRVAVILSTRSEETFLHIRRKPVSGADFSGCL